MDLAIKENVEFYGAVKTLVNKGDKGLDKYFNEDMEKKEAFIQKAELCKEYDKLKEACLSCNTERIKSAESAIKDKILPLSKSWERTAGEQKVMDTHLKKKM